MSFEIRVALVCQGYRHYFVRIDETFIVDGAETSHRHVATRRQRTSQHEALPRARPNHDHDTLDKRSPVEACCASLALVVLSGRCASRLASIDASVLSRWLGPSSMSHLAFYFRQPYCESVRRLSFLLPPILHLHTSASQPAVG